MNFKQLLILAKGGDTFAIGRITEMYRPLLIKESIVNGTFDKDLHQELWLTLMNCMKKIKIFY